MRRTLYCTICASLLLVFLLSGQMVQAEGSETASPEIDQRYDSGIKVEFDAEPLSRTQIRAGEDVILVFRIADSVSGEAITHLHPAAWLTLGQPGEDKPDQETCEGEIGALLRRGLINKKADADLNSFFILTLNVDNSIGIIDPSINLNTANLLALIRFDGTAEEWVVDEENGKVYITIPEKGKVALADLKRRNLKGYLEVGNGPKRIELSPDGLYVWVASEGSGTVSAIDRDNQSIVHTFKVGAGPMDLALDENNRFAFLASGSEGRIYIIDIQQMKEAARVETGKGELAMTWSILGSMLFAVNKESGMVMVIDPEKRSIVNRFDMEKGAASLKITPDGRYILALFPEQRSVKVIDVATNRVTGQFSTEADPDHIIFTDDYAYIRNRGTANISVVPLKDLENPGKAGVVSVPFGVTPPNKVTGSSKLNPMAVFPHGGHILGLNPADKTVSLYMEGMMVPMSSFKAYTDRPMGLLVYSQGLREGKVEGEYSATVRLEKAGKYNVPFYLESPLVAKCFELVVEENSDIVREKSQKPVFSGLFGETIFQREKPARLQFKLVDETTGNPITDVKDMVVMSFRQKSHWQHRVLARHVADGLYEAEFIYPKEGKYNVLIEARSIGISFGDLRHEVANVE